MGGLPKRVNSIKRVGAGARFILIPACRPPSHAIPEMLPPPRVREAKGIYKLLSSYDPSVRRQPAAPCKNRDSERPSTSPYPSSLLGRDNFTREPLLANHRPYQFRAPGIPRRSARHTSSPRDGWSSFGLIEIPRVFCSKPFRYLFPAKAGRDFRAFHV